MPEGPEIRLAADRIARVLVGETVLDAFIAPPALETYTPRLIGATVTAVDTRGKAMLTRFDNGLTLYSHNQLYGRWYVTKPDRQPATRRSLRVALHTARGTAWLYSASDIEILTRRGVERHAFLSRLGPDVLDGDLTAAGIVARLEDDRFRRRSLGALYLDQSFLAGIGNYLRSEILHRARLHPATRPQDLTRRERSALARETLRLSRRSYRTRGITVDARLAARLKDAGLRRGRYRFWVFGREGEPCHDCGQSIERLSVGSRGLFICPQCQPARTVVARA